MRSLASSRVSSTRILTALLFLLLPGTAVADVVVSQQIDGALWRVGTGAYLTQDNGIVDVSPASRTPLLPATHLTAISLKFMRTEGDCSAQRFHLQVAYLSPPFVLEVSRSLNSAPADGSEATFVFGPQPRTLDRLWKIELVVDGSPENFFPCNDWDRNVSWLGRFNYPGTHLVSADDRTFSPYFVLSDDTFEDCTTIPPQSITVDSDEPFVFGVLSNARFEGCQHVVDVTVTNKLAGLWLDIKRIRTKSDVDGEARPIVAAVDNPDEVDFAEIGAIPPCDFAGLFDPHCDPGEARWSTKFSTPGTVTFTVTAATRRAAVLTVMDLVFGRLGVLTASDAVKLVNDLNKVETINKAADCLVDKKLGGGARIVCASAELGKLTSRFRQQGQIVSILASYGINKEVSDLLDGILVRLPVAVIEAVVSWDLYLLSTAGNEEPGAVTIKVRGQ